MIKKFQVCTYLVIAIVALSNCSKNRQDAGTSNFSALPIAVISPPDNPQTSQKVALGKLLFWDPILSGTRQVACGTCHHASMGYSDNLDLSIGVNGQGLGISRQFIQPNNIPFVKRNAPSIINTAFNGLTTTGSYDPTTAAMFYDNRTHSLELQSLEPIKSLEEMRGNFISSAVILDSIILRLKNIPQYVQLFANVFQTSDAITIQNLGKSIASFERTIISNHSPFDEYVRGNASALTPAQVQGMTAFTNNGCNKCHSGPMFSDYSLHILSVPDNTKLPTDGGANGTYAFRTPSLRNLALTAPYMHSGVFNSLVQVFDFYDEVGNGQSQNSHVSANSLDANLQRINNNDRQLIIEFLGTLNDASFDKTIPTDVPSGLHPGGNL